MMKRGYFIVLLTFLAVVLSIPEHCSAQRDTEIYFLLDRQQAWAYENGSLVTVFPFLSG